MQIMYLVEDYRYCIETTIIKLSFSLHFDDPEKIGNSLQNELELNYMVDIIEATALVIEIIS